MLILDFLTKWKQNLQHLDLLFIPLACSLQAADLSVLNYGNHPFVMQCCSMYFVINA